jgi:hypothetical protein
MYSGSATASGDQCRDQVADVPGSAGRRRIRLRSADLIPGSRDLPAAGKSASKTAIASWGRRPGRESRKNGRNGLAARSPRHPIEPAARSIVRHEVSPPKDPPKPRGQRTVIFYFFLSEPWLGCQLAAAPFWPGAVAMVLIFSFFGFFFSRLLLCSPLAMTFSSS